MLACIAAACALAGCAAGGGQALDGSRASAAPADIRIDADAVFPESVTSDEAGNIYVGSGHGVVYRAPAGAQAATAWIGAEQTGGLPSIFGVLADDRSGRLWLCANPDLFSRGAAGVSTLMAFDLATGARQAAYPFPAGQPAACNDIAVAEDGTVFATETAGGRIFALAPGSSELALWAGGEDLVGVDGIAFAGDGTMYINNVRRNTMQRVERAAIGSFAGLTALTLSRSVSGPDGLRPLGGNCFLQAEGSAGLVALVTITGENATIEPVREGLESSPGVTRVGDVGYAAEGKIQYRIDPALRGQDPGPFMIRAFALPEGL